MPNTLNDKTKTEHPPTEQELVERWRAESLERAGFPEDTAAELATRGDIDLHRAIELLQGGCAPVLAADILR